MGTNFSRRKELMPDPPSPAFTRTTTRSMNMTSLSLDARPKHARGNGAFGAHDGFQRVDGRRDDACGDANVQRAVQMRVQLPILPRRDANGQDAQLAPT